jgi:hypothetical protein
MSKKMYRLTDQANIELRRRATDGRVALTARGAKYELLRGTIEPDVKPVNKAAPATSSGA